MLAGAPGSVSFTVYIIDEEKADFSHEIPFGFFIPLLLFFTGLSVRLFFHLYNFTIEYMIPGAAFLVVLFSLIKDKKLLR